MQLSKQNNSLYFIILLTVIFSGCSSKTTLTEPEGFSLNSPRYGHATVNDGKKIYVLGGSGLRKFTDSIEIIDPITKNIEVLQGLLLPRRYFSAVWDGKHSIYILGGVSKTNGKARLEKRVEVFNTITHEVTFAKPLPVPTRINTAVVLDGSIFVMGGSGLHKRKLKATPLVGVYDIKKNSWLRAADMPTAKATRAVVKDNFIYVIGGYNRDSSLNVFERFNPILNTWESLPSMPEGLSAHSVALVNDKLYTFGNYHNLETTYSYDFSTKMWEKVDIGYIGRRHTAATTLNDITYVIGGNTTPDGSSAQGTIQEFKLN